MRRRVSLDGLEEKIAARDYFSPRPVAPTYSGMVRRVIENDLTDRQKEFVKDYFFKGFTLEEIGRKYGVSKSSVCRTVKRAKTRIYNALRIVVSK